jgi:hypothetical protein
MLAQQASIPGLACGLVVHAAWSRCPGPQGPHKVWPCLSAMVVVLLVVCFFLSATNARRPARLACGLLSWTSVASMRRWTQTIS